MESEPKWAGERYAIPPASFPFLRSSSLHPPLPQSFLILPSACSLASPSSFFPAHSSLLPPFACERDPMALAALSQGSLGSSVRFSVPGISEFPGILRCDRLFALHCVEPHCVTLRRTCMWIASCFTLSWFTLLYFALSCTSSHCLALPSLTLLAILLVLLPSHPASMAMCCIALPLHRLHLFHRFTFLRIDPFGVACVRTLLTLHVCVRFCTQL